MRKLFIFLLALLISTIGCRAKTASGQASGSSGMPVQEAVTVQETIADTAPVSSSLAEPFSGTDIEIRPQCPPSYGIALRLPEDWTYECAQTDDDPTSNLVVSVYPKTAELYGAIIIEHATGYGVCGTGLRMKDIVFNGHEAKQGFYDEQSMWSFILLSEPKDCVIINSAQNWYSEYEKQIDQILSTVEFVYYEN